MSNVINEVWLRKPSFKGCLTNLRVEKNVQQEREGFTMNVIEINKLTKSYGSARGIRR